MRAREDTNNALPCTAHHECVTISAAMIAAGGRVIAERMYFSNPAMTQGLAEDLAEDVLRAALSAKNCQG